VDLIAANAFGYNYVQYNTIKSISIPPGLKLMLWSDTHFDTLESKVITYRNPLEANEAKCVELDQDKMPEVLSF